jgi:hypothetical protein
MEAEHSSKRSADYYQTTWPYIPEGSTHHVPRDGVLEDLFSCLFRSIWCNSVLYHSLRFIWCVVFLFCIQLQKLQKHVLLETKHISFSVSIFVYFYFGIFSC